MLKAKFLAECRYGDLIYQDKKTVRDYVLGLGEKTIVQVTISKPTKTRSDNQNGYYWGVVLKIMSKETGHTEEELHEIFKRKFLPPKVVTYRGVGIKMPSSTADTNTLEFTDYIERIRAEAGTMGITIPDPDQVHF